jgi:hypothetical protein
MSISKFESAYNDYKYLKNRGFPEKASLKLIGDKYRLTRMGRNSLFRGVMDDETAVARKHKSASVDMVRGAELGIDWYNVLITVESYLRGSILFLSDDGVLRDSSAIHGNYRKSAVTAKALPEIVRTLSDLAPLRIDIFLDSPIAFSGQMAEEIRTELARKGGPPFSVELAQSADYPLKSYKGIVASSDSVVLDSASLVFDLPRHVLESSFSFTPMHLLALAQESEGPWQLFESGSPGP